MKMRIISGILFVAIAAGSTIAAPLKVASANATLAKRDYENTRWTWSNTRLGACGEVINLCVSSCLSMACRQQFYGPFILKFVALNIEVSFIGRPEDFGLTLLK